jgi:hypothetical protein
MTAGLFNRFPEAAVLTDGRLHYFVLSGVPSPQSRAGRAPVRNLGRGTVNEPNVPRHCGLVNRRQDQVTNRGCVVAARPPGGQES